MSADDLLQVCTTPARDTLAGWWHTLYLVDPATNRRVVLACAPDAALLEAKRLAIRDVLDGALTYQKGA